MKACPRLEKNAERKTLGYREVSALNVLLVNIAYA